jgi:hypothetical protein
MKGFERFLRERRIFSDGEFRNFYTERLKTGKSLAEILLSSGRLSESELRRLVSDYLSEIEREAAERVALKVIRRDRLIPENTLSAVASAALSAGKPVFQALSDQGYISEDIRRKCVDAFREELRKEIRIWRLNLKALLSLSAGTISDSAQEALTAHGPPSLLAWFVLRNYVTDQQLEEALDHKQKTGEPVILTLVSRNFLTPEEAEAAVRSYGVFSKFVARSFTEWLPFTMDSLDVFPSLSMFF